MAKPKLSTKTPDAVENNALVELHESILALPRERRYGIVEFVTKKIDRDIATGDEQATMQIVQIEIPSGADKTALEALLDKTFTARTNLKTRPNPNAEADTPLEGLGDTVDDSV